MPRVPLQQLKDQKKEGLPDNNNEEPKQNLACKLRALWRKLSEAVVIRNRKNQGLRDQNNEEDKEKEGQKETQLDDTMLAIAAEPIDANDGGIAINVEPEDRKGANDKKYEMPFTAKKPLNMAVNTMKAIKEAQIRLQKENRGRKLRVVVVESDSEDEENVQNNTVEENRGLAFTEEKCKFTNNQEEHLTVQADVHQEYFLQFGEEERTTGIGTNVTNDSRNIEKPGNFGGARPKQKMMNPRRQEGKNHPLAQKPKANKNNENTENMDKDEKSEGLHMKRHHRDKQKKEQNEVHWGLDESSESDGVWDCDDIRLLPM